MAIKLIASYSKKVGLPGFSSVGLNLAVETELQNLDDVTRQSEQLYKLLQKSVDDRLQQSPGFIPPPAFGMEHDKNGEWVCSPKQRELIEKIIAENKSDQTEIEQLATGMFGLRLQQLNKLQASGFIDELLDRHGNGKRNGFRQPRSRSGTGVRKEATA